MTELLQFLLPVMTLCFSLVRFSVCHSYGCDTLLTDCCLACPPALDVQVGAPALGCSPIILAQCCLPPVSRLIRTSMVPVSQPNEAPLCHLISCVIASPPIKLLTLLGVFSGNGYMMLVFLLIQNKGVQIQTEILQKWRQMFLQINPYLCILF